MKAGALLLLILSLLLLAAILWRGIGIDDETVRLVPFQAPPDTAQDGLPEHCQADALHRAITEALDSSGISIAGIDALRQLPGREARRLVDRILECRPWSLAADQVHTSGAVVDAWLHKRSFAALSPTARRACQAFRWQSASFETIAASCDRVLSGLPGRWAASSTPQGQGLLLGGTDEALQEVNRRFLIRPYDPQRMVDLALRLERAGHLDAARRLHREVLQISPDAASTLENAVELQADRFRP